MAWTLTGGGSHETDDWLITSDCTVGGTHTDVGIFRIASGVTVTIDDEEVLKVECIEAQVLGDIDGDGCGGYGDAVAGGSGGTSGSINGGNGTSQTGADASGGSGGNGVVGDGGNGGDGDTPGNNSSHATNADCYIGGGAGAGGGGGGGYGTSNGSAGDQGRAVTRGGAGCWIDATRKAYTSAGSILCNASSSTINPDGGGGGAGWSTGAGGGGGGGAGGGAGGCILVRALAVKLAGGTLEVDGSGGGKGGDGGEGGLNTNPDSAGNRENPGDGGDGGDGGTGGRIKITTAYPESVHLTEPTTDVLAGSGGAGGSAGSGSPSGSSGSSGSSGTAGTYKKSSTGTGETPWIYDPRLIYQEGGIYLKRMRANLLS